MVACRKVKRRRSGTRLCAVCAKTPFGEGERNEKHNSIYEGGGIKIRDINKLIKIYCRLICCIRKYNGKLTVFDADKTVSNNTPLKGIRAVYGKSINIFDTVWILVGVKGKSKRILQVGKSSSLGNMFKNDILPDIKMVIETRPDDKTKRYAKYHRLMNEEGFGSLWFYEVNIIEYLKNDNFLNKCFNSDTASEYYDKIFSRISAGYCEGKIAALYEADEKPGIWYRSGGIEGIAFDIYKEAQKKDK